MWLSFGPPSWLSPKLHWSEMCVFFGQFRRWMIEERGAFPTQTNIPLNLPNPNCQPQLNPPPPISEINLLNRRPPDWQNGRFSLKDFRVNEWYLVLVQQVAPRWHLISRIFAAWHQISHIFSFRLQISHILPFRHQISLNLAKLQLTWWGFWTVICGAIIERPYIPFLRFILRATQTQTLFSNKVFYTLES